MTRDAQLIGGTLVVTGKSSFDNGNMSTDGFGNLSVNQVNATSSIGVGTILFGTESGTAPAIITGGTITTTGLFSSRLAPAGAITGVIMQAGTSIGQEITVVNESAAANTITMAAAGTSNVADGVSTVIAGLTAARFKWNSATALWYHIK